ncbi:MAG: ImmA/IrrE family metallo-endopeptidase [Solirubrobacterales bacterium]
MEEDGVDVEALEARAEAVLSSVPEWLWDGETLPVPIDAIADTCFGLYVDEVDDLSTAPGCPEVEPGQTLSGLLLPEWGEIWVNADEAADPIWGEQRCRFTVGHELGHWVLHRTGQQSLFCRPASVKEEGEQGGAEESRPPLPQTEEEANVFSAALLMPPELIRHHYYDSDRDFEELCRRFKCSGAAMSRRLRAVIV